MSRPFQVGDRVVCSLNGLGIVEDSSYKKEEPYCVLVMFNDGNDIETYTETGAMFVDSNPRWFIRHLSPLEESLL